VQENARASEGAEHHSEHCGDPAGGVLAIAACQRRISGEPGQRHGQHRRGEVGDGEPPDGRVAYAHAEGEHRNDRVSGPAGGDVARGEGHGGRDSGGDGLGRHRDREQVPARAESPRRAPGGGSASQECAEPGEARGSRESRGSSGGESKQDNVSRHVRGEDVAKS
jgi:hypothetical protein